MPRDIRRDITKHPKSLPAVTEGAAHPKKALRQPTPSIVLARGAKPVLQTSLQYPAEAAKEHVTGLVEMQLTIAEDGSVQNERVLSGDPLLRAGLAEEVSHWVYQPLRVNGKPVPMTTELAIRFNLN
jgi:TonB family protein